MTYTLMVIALWFTDAGFEPEVISEEYNLTQEECIKLGEEYPVPNDSAITYMCVEDLYFDTNFGWE